MRRVLMSTTAYPPSIGGVQSYVADLAARLRVFRADVVTLWLENRTDWLLGTTLRLGPPRDGTTPDGVRRLGWDRSSRLRMAPWALAYYAAVPVASRRIAALMEPALDRVWSPEHVLVHNHRIGREFFAQASLGVARKHGAPFVLTPHHHPKWRGSRYSGWTGVYRAADAVLTLTDVEGRQLVELGVAPERIHLVRGGPEDPLPADAGRFRRRLGVGENPIVLFLGQLYEYKGVATLFEAARTLHERGRAFEVVFVGPHTPFSERFFATHAAPWAHVMGPVDRQSKWDAIEAADVLCLPSAQEAFGRVYLEAWSRGKPVIAGRIPAVSEVVADGRTGLLVDPGRPAELAAALDRLLSDRDLARRLGEEGRRELEKRFSWERVAARTEAVYEQVLQRSPATALRRK